MHTGHETVSGTFIGTLWTVTVSNQSHKHMYIYFHSLARDIM